MNINKYLETLVQQQGENFTLTLSNGFEIWVTRLGKNKNFTLAISDNKDTDIGMIKTYKKVGTITDIDLFRRCFNG